MPAFDEISRGIEITSVTRRGSSADVRGAGTAFETARVRAQKGLVQQEHIVVVDAMRPDELARIWNTANQTHLNASWVMRRICGHRKRGELPRGVRPLHASGHGSPWVVDLERRLGSGKEGRG